MRKRSNPPPAVTLLGPGRPSIYQPDFCELARRLCLLGLDDAELAQFFGVSVDTIYEWDKVHPEFSDARARGKLPADGKVAEKLYHRALGYKHDAVKIFMPAGADAPVYAPYQEQFPPDTQAATWWLKNRQKEKWKERIESNVNVEIGDKLAERLGAARRRAVAAPVIDGTAE